MSDEVVVIAMPGTRPKRTALMAVIAPAIGTGHTDVARMLTNRYHKMTHGSHGSNSTQPGRSFAFPATAPSVAPSPSHRASTMAAVETEEVTRSSAMCVAGSIRAAPIV